jgi:hypothetical protein
MSDLYTVLGVARDADRATIRHAYRHKARHAHPDAGGSPQEFVRIKIAYDTLIDETRRRRYDETGEFDELPIDKHRNQLLEMLAAGLDLAMLKLSKRSELPKNSDIVQLTREALSERRQGWIELGHKFGKTVVEHRIAVCQKEIETLTERVKLVNEALEVLNGVTFQPDRELEPLPFREWISMAESIQLRFK